jgi:hypothetical protein
VAVFCRPAHAESGKAAPDGRSRGVRRGRYALSNVPSGDYRIAAADLEPEVWFDAEALSKLFERSVPARTDAPRSLTFDLTAP